jgi:ABC-type transport system substrate-binding protein
MKKRVAAFLFVLLLASSACGGGSGNAPADSTTASSTTASSTEGNSTAAPSSPSEPQYGGVLKIIGGADASVPLGWPWELMIQGQNLLPPWIETFFVESFEGDISPWLAKSWEIDTEKNEIRLVLEEGVKFQDGSDFNAEVAVWNVKQQIASGYLTTDVMDAEVRGEYEMAILVKAYWTGFFPTFCSHSYGMISMENYEDNGADYAHLNPVGTGPFILTERVPGSHVVFSKNENYWREGEPYLDEIRFVQLQDDLMITAALTSVSEEESADILTTFSGEHVSMLRDDPGLYIQSNPIGPIVAMPSSLDENSPLAKKEVRQAISYAINREALCAARGFGIFTPAYQIIPAPYEGSLPESQNLPSYDPDKAKELLTQAGYPDGFSTQIIGMPGLVDQDICVAMQGMLEAVGIKAELLFPESGYASDLRNNGWDGLLMMHVRALSNVSDTYYLFFHPDYLFHPSMWRPVEQFEGPFYASRITMDVEEESKLLQQVHQIFLDEMMCVPIYNIYETSIIRKSVHDVDYTAWSPGTVWIPSEAWKESN